MLFYTLVFRTCCLLTGHGMAHGLGQNSVHRRSQNHLNFSTDLFDKMPELEVVHGVNGVSQ